MRDHISTLANLFHLVVYETRFTLKVNNDYAEREENLRSSCESLRSIRVSEGPKEGRKEEVSE